MATAEPAPAALRPAVAPLSPACRQSLPLLPEAGAHSPRLPDGLGALPQPEGLGRDLLMEWEPSSAGAYGTRELGKPTTPQCFDTHALRLPT